MTTHKPRRTDARLNRERLVTAAQEVFAEAGPEASLNEIARRAGVGPGTLYRNFPHREALLAAVLQERIERLCALAENLLGAESADEALAEWLYAFMEHARLNQGMGSALLLTEDAARGASEPPGIDCHRMIQDAAHALLARAQQRGTARTDLASDDLVPLVVGIALSTAHGGVRQDEEQPRRLLGLVLDAVHGGSRQG
ncbi:TetR/AcrR family transcriptional regulator [Streptomyces sp. NPDC021093]|uniref:TetR/AcrR family transcriptional regulator n=1 Tax=Streptomyces sp. NPDC021093 TaxID=3365112 RepID=UPI0037B5280A